MAIPKTAADITETSLEVEMDIYKSSILLSLGLFYLVMDNALAEKQFPSDTIKIIVYQSWFLVIFVVETQQT